MSKQTLLVRKLALTALFSSMGIVLKTASIVTPTFRFSFFDGIIIFSGMTLGPLYGLATGFIVDVLEFIIIARGYPFSFTILFSTMLTGFIPGFIFHSYKQKRKIPYFRIILSVIIATTLSFGLNSLYFYLRDHMGFLKDLPSRTIVLLIKWPLYSVVLPILYRVYLKYSPLSTQSLLVKN